MGLKIKKHCFDLVLKFVLWYFSYSTDIGSIEIQNKAATKGIAKITSPEQVKAAGILSLRLKLAANIGPVVLLCRVETYYLLCSTNFSSKR